MTGNITSPETETELTALGGFRRDESLWPRRGLPRARVRQFILLYEEGGPAALPPLVVATVDRRRYLVDGWLRCAAAAELTWTCLPAVVIALPRIEDVYLEALARAADGEQPLSLTQVEKRLAVDRLLVVVRQYSDRCIARLTGTTHPFVGGRRALLEAGPPDDRSDADRLPPSRREGGKIVAAVVRLIEMEQTPGLYSDGAPLDPAAALREAAQARGSVAETLLDRLERWVVKARRDLAGGPESGET